MTSPAPVLLRSLARSPTAPWPEVEIVAEANVIEAPEPSALTPKLLRPLLSAFVPDVVIDTEPVPVTPPPEPAKIPTAPFPVVVRRSFRRA